jgi:uncharacterized protein DUF3180
VKPTRLPHLIAIAILVGGLTHVVIREVYGSLPALPRYAPASLVFVAVSLGLTAAGTRNRLAGRSGRPINPLLVARYAALAKACSVVGAALTGFYVGILAYVLTLTDAPIPRSDSVTASGGAVAAIAVVITALALEHVCRVPPPPEDHDDDDGEPG